MMLSSTVVLFFLSCYSQQIISRCTQSWNADVCKNWLTSASGPCKLTTPRTESTASPAITYPTSTNSPTTTTHFHLSSTSPIVNTSPSSEQTTSTPPIAPTTITSSNAITTSYSSHGAKTHSTSIVTNLVTSTTSPAPRHDVTTEIPNETTSSVIFQNATVVTETMTTITEVTSQPIKEKWDITVRRTSSIGRPNSGGDDDNLLLLLFVMIMITFLLILWGAVN